VLVYVVKPTKVQYRRDSLMYLHWVSGELLDVEPDD